MLSSAAQAGNQPYSPTTAKKKGIFSRRGEREEENPLFSKQNVTSLEALKDQLVEELRKRTEAEEELRELQEDLEVLERRYKRLKAKAAKRKKKRGDDNANNSNRSESGGGGRRKTSSGSSRIERNEVEKETPGGSSTNKDNSTTPSPQRGHRRSRSSGGSEGQKITHDPNNRTPRSSRLLISGSGSVNVKREDSDRERERERDRERSGSTSTSRDNKEKDKDKDRDNNKDTSKGDLDRMLKSELNRQDRIKKETRGLKKDMNGLQQELQFQREDNRFLKLQIQSLDETTNARKDLAALLKRQVVELFDAKKSRPSESPEEVPREGGTFHSRSTSSLAHSSSSPRGLSSSSKSGTSSGGSGDDSTSSGWRGTKSEQKKESKREHGNGGKDRKGALSLEGQSWEMGRARAVSVGSFRERSRSEREREKENESERGTGRDPPLLGSPRQQQQQTLSSGLPPPPPLDDSEVGLLALASAVEVVPLPLPLPFLNKIPEPLCLPPPRTPKRGRVAIGRSTSHPEDADVSLHDLLKQLDDGDTVSSTSQTAPISPGGGGSGDELAMLIGNLDAVMSARKPEVELHNNTNNGNDNNNNYDKEADFDDLVAQLELVDN